MGPLDRFRRPEDDEQSEVDGDALAFPIAEARRLRALGTAELGDTFGLGLVGGVARGGLFQGAAGGGRQLLAGSRIGRDLIAHPLDLGA